MNLYENISMLLNFWKAVVQCNKSKFELFGQKRCSKKKIQENTQRKKYSKSVTYKRGNIIV